MEELRKKQLWHIKHRTPLGRAIAMAHIEYLKYCARRPFIKKGEQTR